MTLPMALLLSGLSGYFSLSQEIVWVHAISYGTGGKPRDFAHVLGAFLLGIALGSLLSQRAARRPEGQVAGPIAVAFVVSGGFAYLALPLLGRAFAWGGEATGVVAAQLCVAVIALVSGFSFPLLCQLGRNDERRAGVTLSLIYFANIAGAVCGPLFTTFVLMDHLPLDRLMRWIAVGTVASGMLALLLPGIGRRARVSVLGATAAFVLLAFVGHDRLYGQLLERLHYKRGFAQARPYKHLVETRSGVVAVADDGQDTIFGGGVYDGRFNIDPVKSTNLIQRAYAIAILHPNPERMLEIGLASGSWARVAAAYPKVKHLDIVEINPGYLDVIRHFPEQHEILADPKVAIHIDDGRRWLHRHPDERYDFILMNTTFHWRNQSTNLLSRELLELARAHLRPGGVVFYNATQSSDVFYTAAQVFPVVARLHNFVAAGDAPFALDEATRRRNLASFSVDGRPAFDLSRPEARAVVDQLATWSLADEGGHLRRRTDLWCITDDNMATEFKGPRGFLRPATSWSRVLAAVLPALTGD
jgi:spermidine synthase